VAGVRGQPKFIISELAEAFGRRMMRADVEAIFTRSRLRRSGRSRCAFGFELMYVGSAKRHAVFHFLRNGIYKSTDAARRGRTSAGGFAADRRILVDPRMRKRFFAVLGILRINQSAVSFVQRMRKKLQKILFTTKTRALI